VTATEPADPTRSKSVIEGKLLFISPSLLSQFDDSSKYGCERAGFFEYVLGKKSPPNYKMTRGTHLALMQEEYLKSLGRRLLGGTEEQTKWFKKLQPHLDKRIASGRIIGVERPVESLRVAGVPVHPNSKSDLVLDGPPEIEDLKTTGNIEKNGKNEVQLAKDTQLILYAKEFHPSAEEVILTHSQLQLEGSLVHRVVTVTVSQKDVDRVIATTIVPLVERVKSLVGEKDVKAIPRANQSKCFRCNHRGYCPPEKENPLMSILDKFKPKSAAAASPVTPPDAPASSPATNAKPVEGFQAVPPPRSAERQAVVDAAKKITDVDPPAAPNDGLDDEERAALAAIRKKKEEKLAKEKAAAEAKALADLKVAAAAAKKAAEEKAAEVDDSDIVTEGEVKKGKGGRPPGSPNKPKQLNCVSASFGLTLNLGIDVGAVRFDASFEDYCEPDEMAEVYGALLTMAKEQVNTAAQEFQSKLNAAGKK
jgi:hypothetical protein